MWVYYMKWGLDYTIEVHKQADVLSWGIYQPSMCLMMIPGTFAQMRKDYDT